MGFVMYLKSVCGEVLYEGRARSFRRLVEEAVEKSISLDGVDFRGVNLSRANLSGIKASRACFWGADLSHTCLSGADLSNVTFSCPSLFSLDLIKAKTFESSIYSHLGEANIDLSSLPLVIQGLNMPIVVMKDHVLVGEVVKKINCYQDIHTHISSFLKHKKII